MTVGETRNSHRTNDPKRIELVPKTAAFLRNEVQKCEIERQIGTFSLLPGFYQPSWQFLSDDTLLISWGAKFRLRRNPALSETEKLFIPVVRFVVSGVAEQHKTKNNHAKLGGLFLFGGGDHCQKSAYCAARLDRVTQRETGESHNDCALHPEFA